MLTDEDLTRQLGAAFSDTTEDLSYAGRVPAPRSMPRLAVPIGATIAAAAVLTVVAATATHDGPAPTPPVAIGPSAPVPSPAHKKLVTSTIRVAGYTFTYRRAAGEPDPVSWTQASSVPDDATPVDTAPPAHAWVGTDPATGDAALWMKAPTRNEGNLFVILSATWTQDQLVDLLHNGSVGYKSAG